MTKVQRINLRLTDQERAALNILAWREGLKISELTRTLLREALRAREVKIPGLSNLLFAAMPDKTNQVQHGNE